VDGASLIDADVHLRSTLPIRAQFEPRAIVADLQD